KPVVIGFVLEFFNGVKNKFQSGLNNFLIPFLKKFNLTLLAIFHSI
ncbi:hypothetical protein CP02DC14_1114, partial [Chlamydia psittaci 02DC14]